MKRKYQKENQVYRADDDSEFEAHLLRNGFKLVPDIHEKAERPTPERKVGRSQKGDD